MDGVLSNVRARFMVGLATSSGEGLEDITSASRDQQEVRPDPGPARWFMKEKMDYDWMDMRVWRFWFRTVEQAKRVEIHVREHLGWKSKKSKGPLEYLQRFRNEVRFQLVPGADSNIDFGVVPAGRYIRVHFSNCVFLATWFVHRATVYDLVWDGKPSTHPGFLRSGPTRVKLNRCDS